MSDDPLDTPAGPASGAKELLARAAGADARAESGMRVAVEDFFLSQDGRLDDRTRTALSAVLRRLVDNIEAEIREYGVRQLTERGETALADALSAPGTSLVERLAQAGMLRDPALMGDLIARVRLEGLGAALPVRTASLINRFVQHPDRVLASSAKAVLIAENGRRGGPDAQFVRADLPGDLQRKLVWWVTAALRERTVVADEASPLLDRMLVEGAQRSLVAYVEGDRLEAAALRFAAALDAGPHELAGLLLESLGDRQPAVFTALLAHALGASYEAARELVLDPATERLCLALRSLDLGRETIAPIGFALCEADKRRDLEYFADMLDVVMTIDTAEARATLEPIRHDPHYRAAALALRQAGKSA
jgi:hypothetical protein